ncbi:hypothetical protein CkP1_0226 [Citrobacter phage CkP1]|nr:hypothetical protein CkP1_0226 [Citrobacter phage CkP1]
MYEKEFHNYAAKVLDLREPGFHTNSLNTSHGSTPGTHCHNLFVGEVVKNGDHTYTKLPDGKGWKHNSPWGSTGTYWTPSKILDKSELYVLVTLGEAGTMDRSCSRSGLITLERAEREAEKFIKSNPGGEAIILSAIKSYKGKREVSIVTEDL